MGYNMHSYSAIITNMNINMNMNMNMNMTMNMTLNMNMNMNVNNIMYRIYLPYIYMDREIDDYLFG
jgi:hypothetical protein